VNNKCKVAVFGDFMNDLYWIGEANRLSPEAPIPVVKIKETKLFPGGAGNVMANLEALGIETVVCFPGRDASATHYPIKNRLMIGDHQIARWDEDDECRPVDWNVEIDSLQADAIVVADYGKGSITDNLIKQIKQFKGPIFVDTKQNPSVWSGVATVIFPNEKEFNQYYYQYAEVVAKGSHLVLKKGVKGLQFINTSAHFEDAIHSPSQTRFIRSVNGAGDTVMAAFVYKYLLANKEAKEFCKGAEYEMVWEAMLDFANTAAAIAVENPYTYAPTEQEINERFYAK
jgi:bifunctional ADP-heptose synthase (sugar kinase/adenylyltransferase)